MKYEEHHVSVSVFRRTVFISGYKWIFWIEYKVFYGTLSRKTNSYRHNLLNIKIFLVYKKVNF